MIMFLTNFENQTTVKNQQFCTKKHRISLHNCSPSLFQRSYLFLHFRIKYVDILNVRTWFCLLFSQLNTK